MQATGDRSIEGSGVGTPALLLRDVGITFGGLRALDGVSFSVPSGGIYGLIGPNGAGKTTLFNCMTRLYSPSGGEIVFHGQPIQTARRSDIVRLGMARTFQNVGLFPKMTVTDNVLIGAHHRRRDGFFSPILQPALSRREERRAAGWTSEVLSALDLEPVADRLAGDLPYGTLKRLEIARALAAAPSLLLLDEPAAGLTQGEVVAFEVLLRRLHQRFELTILMVEHNMRLVMSLCERIIVMHLGRKLAEGAPDQIQSDPAVVAAYLGTPA